MSASYFVAYALTDKLSMNPSMFGNVVIELPHEFNDFSDIDDFQKHIEKEWDNFQCTIIFIKKLPY